jgi:hypothetical protein
VLNDNLDKDLYQAVDVVVVNRSAADYAALIRQIGNLLGLTGDVWWSDNKAGVTSVTIDVPANLLIITVSDDQAGAATRGVISSRYSQDEVRVQTASATIPAGLATCADGTWKCDWNWIYSGLLIANNGLNPHVGLCTSATAVFYGPPPPGYSALLTAGHCLAPYPSNAWTNERWAQGFGTYRDQDMFGWDVARLYSGDSFNTPNPNNYLIEDAGLIYNNAFQTRPDIGRVHITSANNAAFLSGYYPNPVQGGFVCQAGATSTGYSGNRYLAQNYRCGYVRHVYSQFNGGCGCFWPRDVVSDYLTGSGDSGSVVYSSDMYAVAINSSIVAVDGGPSSICRNEANWYPGPPTQAELANGDICENSSATPIGVVMAVWGLRQATG